MAATDMRLAGLEPGCKVLVDCFDDGVEQAGRVRDITDAFGKPDPEGGSIGVDLNEGEPAAGQKSFRTARHNVTRDYDEAQATRQRRFGILHEHFGGDAGVPEETDTIERYVMVQRDHAGEVVYYWGDDWDTVTHDAGGRISLDKEHLPDGIYDLDTGRKIDVHPRTQIVADEEQGQTINELNPDEVEANRKFVEEHYDEVAVTFHISATVPPEHAETFKAQVDEILNGPLTEWAALQAERIRQMRPDTADKLKEQSGE